MEAPMPDTFFFAPTDLDDKMYPYRIPGANAPHFAPNFNGQFWVNFSRLNDWPKFSTDHLEASDERKGGWVLSKIGQLLDRHFWLYARGEELGVLANRMSMELLQAQDFYAQYLDAQARLGLPSGGGITPSKPVDVEKIALLLLLTPDPKELNAWMSMLLKTDLSARLPEIDVLLKAFAPELVTIPKKYPRWNGTSTSWLRSCRDKFRIVLAQSTPKTRTAALVRYMNHWGRMMKPVGWKPRRSYRELAPDGRAVDPNSPGDTVFVHFAFEVALAVCAWDLDDSALRDHPDYPRDAVDYYRAHVRHTRDAWRAEGVGSGIVMEPPQPPKKVDLSKSKLKGYARWVELVCDGDKEAREAVIDTAGRLRSLKKAAAEVLAAMAENGQGVCADIKDDGTMEAQIDSLLEARGLEGFDSNQVSGAGPARCEALLKSVQEWLVMGNRGYRFQGLDLGDDAWYGLMVRDAFAAEFIELGQTLGLPGNQALI
jgi:hypothetical protein